MLFRGILICLITAVFVQGQRAGKKNVRDKEVREQRQFKRASDTVTIHYPNDLFDDRSKITSFFQINFYSQYF